MTVFKDLGKLFRPHVLSSTCYTVLVIVLGYVDAVLFFASHIEPVELHSLLRLLLFHDASYACTHRHVPLVQNRRRRRKRRRDGSSAIRRPSLLAAPESRPSPSRAARLWPRRRGALWIRLTFTKFLGV